MADVILNEKFVGTVENPYNFIKTIKEERRKNRLPDCLNIGYDEEFDEVTITTAQGRARRPLIIVEDGKPLLTEEHIAKLKAGELSWKDLVEQGCIEYLDATEEENAYIALNEKFLTKEHTHLEISPLAILGLTTSLVPYANFGQAPRLIKGSKTQKQALGLYAANYLQRFDTDVSVLQYPQVPIVQSIMHRISKYKEFPAGQNIVIALLGFEGYNMQDSIILNKGSIERGFGRSYYYRPYTAEELRYQGGMTDVICIPDKEVSGYKSEQDYKYLEDDGIVYPGAVVKNECVLVGKTSPPRFLSELEEFGTAGTRRESSITLKHGEHGVVDEVVLTENEEGNKLVQVKIRDLRIPELGDKFASRYGQKGVVGRIVPESDMPFTASGIIPDIIFSPHSIPSRMTVSHMIEVIAGKVGALQGEYIEGTTFNATSEADLRKMLLQLGFREDGTERMYNGITGEEYEANIFVGSMYYLKLKYMVANKLHARASGRIQLLTRQPLEGRSKGGGLRMGEMEKDCLVGHGVSLLLKERFDSDKTKIFVCEKCGLIAVYDAIRKQAICQKCGSSTSITPVEISYAFKLLLEELASLCVSTKLNLKTKYTAE